MTNDGIASLHLFIKLDRIQPFDTCPPEEDSTIFGRLQD